jgi:hypothetical protein
MALDQTQFETYLQAAINAMAGGDYATARQQAANARICRLNLPKNYSIQNRQLTRWDNLDDLDKAIAEHERAANGGGDVRMVPIGFGRAG